MIVPGVDSFAVFVVPVALGVPTKKTFRFGMK
jgi:hypothetical protein